MMMMMTGAKDEHHACNVNYKPPGLQEAPEIHIFSTPVLQEAPEMSVFDTPDPQEAPEITFSGAS